MGREITEDFLIKKKKQSVMELQKLRELGISLAIDDFGTGFSSLRLLHAMPIDAVKIDRSFVHDIETDKDDATIVKAIIGLADSLGLEVVAEGVETEQQMEFLRSHGCKMAQGFLFSRPLPASNFEELLAAGRAESVA